MFMEVVFTCVAGQVLSPPTSYIHATSCRFIFLNVQPETGWFLRTNAQKVATVLLTYIQGHIDALRSPVNVSDQFFFGR